MAVIEQFSRGVLAFGTNIRSSRKIGEEKSQGIERGPREQNRKVLYNNLGKIEKNEIDKRYKRNGDRKNE